MNAPGPVAWQARVKRWIQLEASRDFGFAVALGLFGIFLLFVYQPTFVLAPGKHLPDGGESLHNYWMTAHGIRMWKAFSLTSFFDGNQFFPFGQVLAFSDHLLLPSLFATILTWMGASTQSAYGLLVMGLFGFQFAAFAWSCRLFKVGHWPAALGAVLFGVNQTRWALSGNIAILLVGFFPLLLATFVQFWRTKRQGWMVAFSVLVGLLALSGREPLVLCLPLLILCFFSWGKLAFRNPIIVKSTALAWVLLVVMIALVYRPFLRTEALYGDQVTDALRLLASEKWGSLINPGESLRFMKFMAAALPAPHAGSAFVGIVQWLALGALTIGFCVALVRPTWSKRGDFLRVGGWLLFALAVVVFAMMGPRAEGEAFGFNVWRVLTWIPGFESLRAPAHIFVLGQLCIAIAATWVVWKGSESVPKLSKQLMPICCVLALIHLVQMWPSQSWTWRSAEEGVISSTLEETAAAPKAPIAVLSSNGRTQIDELIAARSAHPVITGGGDFTPAVTAEWLVPQLEHCDTHACIDLLQGMGVRFLLVNTAQVDSAAKSFISRSTLVKKVRSEGAWDLYQIESDSSQKRFTKLALGNAAWWKRQLPVKTDQCVPPSAVKTSERPERSSLAADGMIGTVWLTKGPQSPEQWAEFPIGAELAGQDVVLDLEVGFDGELRSGAFARAVEIKWLKPTGLVKEEIVEIQMSLKEPLILLQQIKVKVPAGASGLRLSPLTTSSAAPAWGIAESRLCRQVM